MNYIFITYIMIEILNSLIFDNYQKKICSNSLNDIDYIKGLETSFLEDVSIYNISEKDGKEIFKDLLLNSSNEKLN